MSRRTTNLQEFYDCPKNQCDISGETRLDILKHWVEHHSPIPIRFRGLTRPTLGVGDGSMYGSSGGSDTCKSGVDELFNGSFDDVESFTRRKAALADADRYRALYYVFQRRDQTVYRSELPTEDIQQLLDTNLLARVPNPDGDDEIRITTLGKQAIEADRRKLDCTLL